MTWASLVAQMVKSLPAMRETWVQSLGWERKMATHSSILAWTILAWTILAALVAQLVKKSQG